MQKSCQDLKIIFIGTPEFGAIILEKLVNSEYKPVLVVTAPDKPVGRKQIITPPPTKISAQKHNIPVLQPEILANSKSEILNSKPDLIVVAAYGQILPKEILEIPKFGCLNVHPSLLPKYRGPSPIQTTILNGDGETGVTIMLMDEKVDHGKTISNFQFPISNKKITYPELLKELAELGAKLLVETIPKWINGEIKPKPQDETKATYTKIIKKEDGRIDWNKSAEEIERQVRAFNPWPGTYGKYEVRSMKYKEKKERILKILEAEVLSCGIKKQIGEVFLTEENELAVKCGPRTKTRTPPTPKFGVEVNRQKQSSFGARALQDCLILLQLQLEGGKPMRGEDFLRGHSNFIGLVLQ